MNFFKRLFGRCATPCNSYCAPTPATTVADAIKAKLLDPDYEFRTIGALQKAAPTLSRESLFATLESIGARPAYRNSNLWGLKSVVGERPRRLEY